MPHRPSSPPPRSPRPSRASSPPPRAPRSALEELTEELSAGGRRAWALIKRALPPASSLLWPLWGLMAALSLVALVAPQAALLDAPALKEGRLWALLTAPLTLPPTSPLPLLLLGGLWAYSASGLSRGGGLNRAPLYMALAVTLALIPLAALFGGVVFSLVLSALTLIWFAYPLERDPRRGPRGLLAILAVSLAAASVGGGLWVSVAGGVLHGDTALQRALITAWGLSQGRRRLPWLNIEARDLRWVALAFCALELLLSPSPTAASALAATLAVWGYFHRVAP